MKVGMGSKNKTKLAALAEVLAEYPLFVGAEIIGVDAVTDVFGHPKSAEETADGAIQRAKKAYEGNDYGFGIESGLFALPFSKSGYVEVAVCAIYDGKQVHLGTSPGFEWPKAVIDGILKKGLDGSQAVKEAGMTDQEKVGENEGIVGILTKGRMSRTDYNKTAIMMALAHLEHPEHY